MSFTYSLLPNTTAVMRSDGAVIPSDPRNADWQDYQAWLGVGNVPTPVPPPTLAQQAIAQYKSGQLRTIMIVGHSLGGAAASAMAAELGQAGVPVQLVVMLDPVGGSEVSSNVRRSVNIRPGAGEDHFTVIAAHGREVTNYVLGGKGSGSARSSKRKRHAAR